MRPMTDASEIELAMRNTSRLVERAEDGRFAVLRVAEWCAVPDQRTLHASRINRDLFARAFRESGHDSVWAVALEPLASEPLVYTVDATLEGLKEFSHHCSHFNYALVPPDQSWLVVCTTDDYLLLVGKIEFLFRILGCSISDAYAEFRKYGARTGWSENERAFFESVYLASAEDYLLAAPGTRVQIPRGDVPGPQGSPRS